MEGKEGASSDAKVTVEMFSKQIHDMHWGTEDQKDSAGRLTLTY